MGVIKNLFKKIILIIHVFIILVFINLVHIMVYGQNVGHVVNKNGKVKDVQKGNTKEFYCKIELCYV